MFVVLTLMLVNVNHIASTTGFLIAHVARPWIWEVIAATDASCWLDSVICCYRVLNAIFNPAAFIGTCDGVQGEFFKAGLFKTIPILSLLLGSAQTRERPTLALHVDRVPSSDDAIISELAFEQLKLAYIRDVKASRLRLGFLLGSVVLLLSALLWSFGLATGADAGSSTLISI